MNKLVNLCSKIFGRYFLNYKKGVRSKSPGLIHESVALEGIINFYAPTVISHSVCIGKHTYFNGGSVGENTIIGRFCSIGKNVLIAPEEHPLNRLSTHPFMYKQIKGFTYDYLEPNNEENSKKTRIGNDVWIGANVTIMRGVTIGDSVVIATGSIVTKDIPSFTIAAGVPAKVVKNRVEHEQYYNENGSWWNMAEDKIDVFGDPHTRK